jgi:uncharacterized membrane protein
MTQENLGKVAQFLNSVWLLSTIKEWIFRILFFSFLPNTILFAINIQKIGFEKSLIPFLVSVGVFLLISVLLLGFLYRKFCKGELAKNKDELFKE